MLFLDVLISALKVEGTRDPYIDETQSLCFYDCTPFQVGIFAVLF